jgi:hypothetical protein
MLAGVSNVWRQMGHSRTLRFRMARARQSTEQYLAPPLATTACSAPKPVPHVTHVRLILVRRHSFEQNLAQPFATSLGAASKALPHFSQVRWSGPGKAQRLEQYKPFPSNTLWRATVKMALHATHVRSTRVLLASPEHFVEQNC